MLDINTTYLAFLFLSVILFWRIPVRTAILVTFFGGWLLLPVGHYAPIENPDLFPWWITGLALPADMLISKAWIVPTVAMLCAFLFDISEARRFRPAWQDIPMILWCLWPLIDSLFVTYSNPPPFTAALYITGCWGIPWFIGRIWFCTPDGQLSFLKACAWFGIACLPFAILEGAEVLSFYEMPYGFHPFHSDGSERYLGFRPIGFFEHGNQYGIWVSLSALSAIWLAVAIRKEKESRVYFIVAILTTLIALSAQSVGAILLAFIGLIILFSWRLKATVPLLIVSGCCLALVMLLHLSGIVPIEWIARETKFGQLVLDTFRSLGRGSFLWRVSQDIKSLNIVQNAFLTGTTVWDWWRPSGTRPWGLWLLLIGQFGVIGFLLAYGSLLATAGLAMHRIRGVHIWNKEYTALPLAVIIILALADSFLNAFLYFPAILAAGAITCKKSNTTDR